MNKKHVALLVIFPSIIIILAIILIYIIINQQKVDNMLAPTEYSKNMSTYPTYPHFGDEIFYFERKHEDIIINNSEDNRKRWLEMTPIWEGITPGKTKYGDATKILSENKLFYQVVLPQPFSEELDYQLSFRWIERQTTSEIIPKSGDALFDRDSGINTCVRIPIQPITLSELITMIGEPSNIISQKLFPIESDQEISWSIKIIYMEKGISLAPLLLENNIVEKDVMLNSIVFFEPTKEGFIKWTHEETFLEFQPWVGYGAYEEK